MMRWEGDVLQLGDDVASVEYELSRLRFVEGFRSEGALLERWRSINMSKSRL